MQATIYLNSRCSKSHQTPELLRERNVTFNGLEYLTNPLNEATISGLVTAPGMASAHDLIRRREQVHKHLDLSSDKSDEAALIAVMAADPILIERPIVVADEKPAIGRPPNAVLKIL